MFKLNQIQMDIRRKFSEETKDDKVHKKDGTTVKNNKSDKPFVDEIQVDEKKNQSKRYLTISAEKVDSNVQKITVVKSQEAIVDRSSGMFIDKIK